MKEIKNHKKMYKSGKNWVIASLATTLIALGAFNANVHADNNLTIATDSDSVNTQQVADASANTIAKTGDTTENDGVSVASTSQSEITDNSKNNIDTQKSNNQSTSKDSQLDGETESQQKSAIVKKQDTNTVSDTQTANNNTVTTITTNNGLNDETAKVIKNAGIDPSTLTTDQIEELNKINFSKNAQTGTQMTYSDFKAIADTLISQDSRYAIPYFNAKQIKNMPAATTRDAQTGQVANLDIWDSWPVQSARTGYVTNWNGYQLVIGMMGIPNTNDNHIYLLYNKYGDNNLSDWKNAGPIFGFNANPVSQEWSGSAIVNPDGSIQLFYTRVDTSDDNTNHQKIASATIYLNHDDTTGTVSIDHVANDHIIFEGDGYYYQTYNQWRATNKGADNIAMRDAHVIEDNDGNRYLIFEASTGLENYQGLSQIYNWQNYGGNDKFNVDNFLQLLSNNDMKDRASWANAAIGILKLTNDIKNPQVSQLYTPLLTAPMVSDEIERPDVVKLGNKYYLFAATRLNRGSNDNAWQAADKAVGDNVVMIGYVSDNLLSGYKPLNNSGVVLTASVPANWRTATYSYYAVPVEGHPDQVLITSYMTNRNEVAGKGMDSTWAPSFLVQINPDNTTTVLAKMTNQGDWIWDNSSENDSMAGVLDKNAANSAALPSEWEKAVDWNAIGGSGQSTSPSNPSTPTSPTNPSNPSTPTSPTNPSNPSTPTSPTNPSNPSTPTSPTNPSNPSTPTSPTNPSNPSTPTSPTNPLNPSTPTVPLKLSTPGQPTGPANLPQTGSAKGEGIMALGFTSLLMMFGLAGTTKRR